jgi:radical SAM superfamily enzyme YgiQ (UPF0313 family)
VVGTSMTVAPTVRSHRSGPVLRAAELACGVADWAGAGWLDLRPEAVLAEATSRARGSDWGDERFIEPMERLLAELAAPPYTAFARFFCRQVAVRAVVQRIRLQRYQRQNPSISAIPIERPVFVLGFPRSGTTLLQNLLACEPTSRALPFWELTNPVPLHPDPGTDVRQRRARASLDLRLAKLIAPEIDTVHATTADSNEECWGLLSNTFAVLNYDLADGAMAFGRWLLQEDVTWAYREYRLMLQGLLHQHPAQTLVLKCPEHLWFLDALLNVFPDACVVWTHRDPADCIASYCSMVSLARRAMFGRVDTAALGEHITSRFADGVVRAALARASAPDRFLDVRFDDLVGDPLGAVRRIRGHFELPVSSEGMDACRTWLKQRRSDSPGRHRYDASSYSLDRAEIHTKFGEYMSRYLPPTTGPLSPGEKRKELRAARRVRALLVHPEFPVTYWGFQYALPFCDRDANLPPLGLITLAGLLPPFWELTLVDMNIEPLTSEQLDLVDVVLVGGMLVQAPSMLAVIERAKRHGAKVVVGGPAPTSQPQLFPDADIVFQGEAEGRIEDLVAAVAQGGPRQVLAAEGDYPPAESFGAPRYDLLRVQRYGAMSLQTSRGCPFHCEFCDVVELFGRKPRVKAPETVCSELAALRATGYRGTVFVVDDNFIGNRKAARGMLPMIAEWQTRHRFPFDLMTEATVNLADDQTLLQGMAAAGFVSVFLGLETPSIEALEAAGKTQNTRRPLQDAVRVITAAGLEVMGGFIVGFDSDTVDVFEAQRAFIQGNPIPMAMVGPLMALPGTQLEARLLGEGRLRDGGSGAEGDQFGRPNFDPVMDEVSLIAGYRDLMETLYSAEAYYDRCEQVLRLAPAAPGHRKPSPADLLHFLRTAWGVGVRSPRRWRFWRLLWTAIWRRPDAFSWAVVRGMIGEHLIRYTEEDVVPRMNDALRVVEEEERCREAG